MSWQSKYLLKLALQKVLGAIPGLFRMQEAYKRWRNNWTGLVDPDFVLSETGKRIADFSKASIVPPKVVVEQGTGWHGTDLVIFALAGAERIHSYDTTPWLRAELLGEILRLAPRMAPIVGTWPGLDLVAVQRRAEKLEALAKRSLPRQLEGLHCTTVVTRDVQRPELAHRSVDLFYSNSVLQRIAPRELRTLVIESERFLRKGGEAFHIVDTKDFHSINDPRVPELGYLRWSEGLWKLATSRFLNYQNRLRSPDFVRMFEAAGLETLVTERLTEPANMAYAAQHYTSDPRFAEMGLEGLATTQTKLCAQVALETPGAAPQEEPASLAREAVERSRSDAVRTR